MKLAKVIATALFVVGGAVVAMPTVHALDDHKKEEMAKKKGHDMKAEKKAMKKGHHAEWDALVKRQAEEMAAAGSDEEREMLAKKHKEEKKAMKEQMKAMKKEHKEMKEKKEHTDHHDGDS